MRTIEIKVDLKVLEQIEAKVGFKAIHRMLGEISRLRLANYTKVVLLHDSGNDFVALYSGCTDEGYKHTVKALALKWEEEYKYYSKYGILDNEI